MNKKQNISNKLFFIFAKVWGIVGIFLVFLQAYLMFQMLILILPLFLIAIYLFLKLLKKIQEKVSKPSKITKIFAYVIAMIHFIPLLLQLFGIGAPGFDNTVMALIGLWIFSLVPVKK